MLTLRENGKGVQFVMVRLHAVVDLIESAARIIFGNHVPNWGLKARLMEIHFWRKQRQK